MTSDSGINENDNKKPNKFKSSGSASRKRILGDRNGVSSCPNSPEKKKDTGELSCGMAGSDITTDHGCRVSPISSDIGEKKSGPYHPRTNFLSPRPEFLRYNPNRRREIFLGRGNLGKIENLSSDESELSGSDSISSGSFSVGEDLIKVESCGDVEGPEGVEIQEEDDDDDVDDDGEEEDDSEEENELGSFRGLKWVLKCLAVFGLLFLCTAYVSTMNSPTPPSGVLAIRNMGDELTRVGSGLMRRIYESDDGGARVVGDELARVTADEAEDVDVEEEIARQLGEVVVVDDNGEEEMSYGVDLYVGNDGIVEEVSNSFDQTTHHVFKGVFTKEEEIVGGTDVGGEIHESHHEDNGNDLSNEMAEEKLVGGSSTHKKTSNSHGDFSESLEKGINVEVDETEEVVFTNITHQTTAIDASDEVTQDSGLQVVGIEVTDVSDEMAEVSSLTSEGNNGEGGTLNWKEWLLVLTKSTTSAIATKESICIALLSLLVAVFASIGIRFQQNCKKASSGGIRSRRRAPLVPRTPVKPRENTMPEEVKLLGEFEFANVCNPVHNYKSYGSEDLGMNSPPESYGSLITEENLTQKKYTTGGISSSSIS